MSGTSTVKPFNGQSEFTIFNNYILDYVMPKTSPNGWKCLSFIIRKTKGWHKLSDTLSFSQIKAGTGIKSDPTVVKALKELETARFVLVKRHDGQWDSNTYTLNTGLKITIETVEPTIENIVDDCPATENIVGLATENIASPTIETIDTKETLKETKKEKEGDKSPPADKQPTPEAVKVYRKIARRYPDKAIWPDIANTVGEKPENLIRWEEVVKAYIGCGWNKLNLSGMLEFFRTDRLPTTKPVKNGANYEHNKPKGRTGADLDKEPVYDPYTGKTEYLPR